WILHGPCYRKHKCTIAWMSICFLRGPHSSFRENRPLFVVFVRGCAISRCNQKPAALQPVWCVGVSTLNCRAEITEKRKARHLRTVPVGVLRRRDLGTGRRRREDRRLQEWVPRRDA